MLPLMHEELRSYFALEGYGDQASIQEAVKDFVKSQIQNGPWTASELLARIVWFV